MVIAALTLPIYACGSKKADVTPEENNALSSQTMQNGEEESNNEIIRTEQGTDSEDTTPITLTIGDKVLNGYLNASAPARSLISQLPLTITLNDSGNDFCGSSLDIAYDPEDIQSGYKNGDLAFWTPASNFVIFVDDEENSSDTDNLIILGKITESQDVLDALEGTIDVKIAVNEEKQEPQEKNNAGEEISEMRVKITAGEHELMAVMEDNATTREIIGHMPMTLPMMDLYGREMCYRYGANALPTDDLTSDRYEIGDIAYWPPGGSLVILYKQNGEKFERQHLGHIDDGVEIFENAGDMDVTFELAE